MRQLVCLAAETSGPVSGLRPGSGSSVWKYQFSEQGKVPAGQARLPGTSWAQTQGQCKYWALAHDQTRAARQ